MSISFHCTKCGKTCQTKSENAGKQAKCPGCGTMFTIPSPQASAKSATPEQASMAGLLDEMDEELRAEKLAAERTPGTEDPTHGRPHPPGQSRRGVRDGAAQASSNSPAASRFTSRYGPESAAKQRQEAKSDWLVKAGAVGTVVVIGAVLLSFGSKFIGGVSLMEIENVVGSPNISNAFAIVSNADWLDLNLNYVPTFAGNCEKRAATESAAGAEGIWIYHIKADQRTWNFTVSATTSLPKGWLNELQRMGYFREYNERPDPIKIQELIIKEPMGRTWVLSEQGDPRRMCNLAVMLGSQNLTVDLTPLMKTKRGTLAYAVFFSSIHHKTSIEQRIARSCDSDSAVRTFAAEMLLTTLPLLRTDATPPDIDDKQQYESMLTQLAQDTSLDEKEKIYEQLREQLLEQLRDPIEEISVKLRREGGLEWF